MERCPECGFHYDLPALRSLREGAARACLEPYLDASACLLAGSAAAATWLLAHALAYLGWLSSDTAVFLALPVTWAVVVGYICVRPSVSSWILSGPAPRAERRARSRTGALRRAASVGPYALLLLLIISAPIALLLLTAPAVPTTVALLVGAAWVVLGEYRCAKLGPALQLQCPPGPAPVLRRARWAVAGLGAANGLGCILTLALSA